MVLPPGHQREIASRRAFSRREKWTVGAVSAGLVAFAVILVIALAGPAQSTARGCVDVTLAGATGGASIHQCGADARSLCREAGAPGGYQGIAGRAIRAACRRDHIPVG